jgi:hypothetical protein
MMEVMEYNSATLDQTFEQIATNEFPNPAVLQLSPTNQIYVSLANKTDLEVNLIVSERKTYCWHLRLTRRLRKKRRMIREQVAV